MIQESKYVKTVIPKSDYMATIVHAEFGKKRQSHLFFLWFVIDTGKYIDQKISQEFPITEFGDQLLSRMCKRMKVRYLPSITKKSSIFPMQFLGYRSKISVDIEHQGNFTRNIIVHHQPALFPPEENVIKSRSVDHFYSEQTGRKLPLL